MAEPAPERSEIDVEALGSLAGSGGEPAGRKLTRKERRAAKRQAKADAREAKRQAKARSKEYKSIKRQLKERDKELSTLGARSTARHRAAKDVTSYIGYDRMYQDGICEVDEGLYSETIEFADTSYHSVRDDVQLNTYKSMGKLYDQFGPSTIVEMTVINTPVLREELSSRRFFDPQRQISAQAAEDAGTFNAILTEKTRQGVSNIRRRRFLTITCSAESADASVPKLSRLEASSSRLLGGVGSKCRTLDGKERLSVLHGLLNPGKPFDMDYKRDLGLRMPQTTKDLIAPTTIDFKPEGRCDCFRLDDMWGQVLVFRRFGSELTDHSLADIVDLPIPMAVSWFAQPIEQSKAIAFVRQRSAWIDKEVIEEQRTAVSKGYDFSILPFELKYSKEEAEGVLDHLTGKGQHLYLFTGLVYTYAPSRQQLDNQVLRIISAARGNFYKFTDGHFTPCAIPDRAPDYRSADSSYWYSDEGVVRQSDHWGRGIASCTWTLGDEPSAPCYRNKGLGQRSGFIPWGDFREPERTVKVSHQFGALDYDKLGALPIESGRDDFGDFDVFAIKREWFIDDAAHFTFAGRTLEAPHRDRCFTSAIGDAYKDPQAQAISIAWNEYRLDAKANGVRLPDLDAWLDAQTKDPAYGSLARSLLADRTEPSEEETGRKDLGCDLDMEARDARDASGSLAQGRDLFREGDAR